MGTHLKAITILIVGTLLLGSALYPLALLAVGQSLFRSQATGSLVNGADGKPIGSRQIAQPFSDDGYFQPRPSAAAYNAAASGGSNWGSNNVKLRDRAARILGPIVRYATPNGLDAQGHSVQENIEAWFRAQKQPVVDWLDRYPTLAGSWVGLEPLNKAYVSQWVQDHRKEIEQLWSTDNPDKDLPDGQKKPEDLGVVFFKSFAAAHPGKWPVGEDNKIVPADSGSDLQATFFDLWLQANPGVELEKVPADMVTASGSGLDPHITMANARYQARRVVKARALQVALAKEKAGRPLTPQERSQIENRLAADVEKQLVQAARAPLAALVGGEPLLNVLEVNLALDALTRHIDSSAKPGERRASAR